MAGQAQYNIQGKLVPYLRADRTIEAAEERHCHLSALSGSKVTMSKGYVTTEQTLEEVYDQFAKSEKKSKEQINFFKDIKELISLFESVLNEQLERAIKVEEL